MRLSKKRVLIRKKGDIPINTLKRKTRNLRNKIKKLNSKLKSTYVAHFIYSHYYLNLLNVYRFSLFCFYHFCKYFIKVTVRIVS